MGAVAEMGNGVLLRKVKGGGEKRGSKRGHANFGCEKGCRWWGGLSRILVILAVISAVGGFLFVLPH